MTHSTHFVYSYMEEEEERRTFLFNDALNTFCLVIWRKEEEIFYLMMHSTHFVYSYMVKDQSDS